MGDTDQQTRTNDTNHIPDKYQDVRHRFARLWNQRTCGDPDEPTLAAAWQTLANLLENHTTTQEPHVENI